jgi:hypothetical protein
MEKILEQIMEHLLANMDATLKEMKANMDAWKEGTKACVGKLEANQEKSDAIVEHQKVPKKEAAVETAGTWKD